jgi:ribosomal-protein-alanine N-acetyltransferase
MLGPRLDAIRLRPISAHDAEAITRLLAGDTELALQTATIPIPYTIDDAHAFLQRADPLQNFAIVAGDELVGGCGFKDEHDGIEIGYWIGRPYWGRGYATAAVALLIEEARRRGLERLYAEVYVENPPSMRVLQKAGFVREGELKRDIPQRGGMRRIVRFRREI